MEPELQIDITSDADIVTARQAGQHLAGSLHFSASDLTVIATTISELGRNILAHAGVGVVRMWRLENGPRRGLMIEACDEGPGIGDIALALQDGYSTSGSPGLGLPGVRRLVDEFAIRSTPEQGTVVTLRLWARGS